MFGRNSSLPDGLTNQCRECQYSSGLWSKYRITAKQYAEILEAQGGVCAICERVNESGNALAVDHDHSCCPGVRSCGECIRSLLCVKCNAAIGMMGDDPAQLRKAAAYLESHRDS